MNNIDSANQPSDDNFIINKKTKYSPYLRAAILAVYGPKCFYTGRSIEPLDAQLDHILPREAHWENRDQLRKTICLYDLPDGFDPNGVENLLPVSPGANRAKSDVPFTENNNRYYLNMARRSKDEVLEQEKRFEADEVSYKLFQNLYKLHSENPKDFDRIISTLENETPTKKPDYKSDSQITYHGNYTTLSAHPPCKTDISPTALVTLNRFTLRSAMITFDAKDMFGTLFRGVGLPAVRDARPWIVGPHTEDPSLVCVQLGNTRCFLQSSAVDELASATDKLAATLYHCVKDIEIQRDALDFEPVGTRKYRLFRVPWWLWELLLQFAAQHDYSKGDSAWHAFNANNPMYISTSLMPRPDIGLSKPCTIWPDAADKSMSLLPSRDEVWLCWQDNTSIYNYDLQTASTMTARETAAWIKGRLIPAAIAWHNTVQQQQTEPRDWFDKIFGTTKSGQTPFAVNMPDLEKSTGYQPLGLANSPHVDSLLESFATLQSFFGGRGSKLRVGSSAIMPLLDAIETTGKTHTDKINDYVLGNLGRGEGSTFEQSISIKRHLLEKTPFVSCDFVDYLMRTLCSLCGGMQFGQKITDEEICKAAVQIQPLFEIYNAELYRERLLKIYSQ